MPDPETASTDPTAAAPALALVHEGWEHLKRQRPLAAWASWRRALRVAPEFQAATRALDILANAGDLPAAARAEYRFFTPVDPASRQRWDAALRGRDLADLADAAAAFGTLAAGGDGRAWFNRGLCLAWLGRNGAAVEALDEAVAAASATEPAVAVTAAVVAEVVRQGAGAEEHADDLNRIAVVAWTDEPGLANPAAFLDDRVDVRAIPPPIDPATGRPSRPDLDVFEWLDGPPGGIAGARGPVRRILATVIRSPSSLRLSGPDPTLLERAVAEVVRHANHRIASVRREATPLPLAFLDAAIWAIRTDPGTEPEVVDRLNRAAVEQYYETTWINQPRAGLGGLTPLAAAAQATAGDATLTARLTALIRVREQLGARPSAVQLYQGYPFDRLRRRLGLEVDTPEGVDPLDPATMSAAELDALDPASLDDFALAEAFASSHALGDDARTARFAERIARLDPAASAPTLGRADLNLEAVSATLVRRELAAGDPDAALGWVDRAVVVDAAVAGGQGAATYTTWRAEILARVGRADAALIVYRQLIAARPTAAVALDAAETMLDNNHDDHAATLARIARDLARDADDQALADRAEAML